MLPPSTPPSSSPCSPKDPKNAVLRTPLRLSRRGRPPIAPLTPQSLVAPKAPSGAGYNENLLTPFTPKRKFSSIRTSNWRVDEESPAPVEAQERGQFENVNLAVPTAPNKPSGPFTPQVKRIRSPLDSDISNCILATDPNVRGSFTDPPPRRRVTRSHLNDEEYFDSDSGKMEQYETPVSKALRSESPASQGAQPQVVASCASCGGSERLSLLQPCQHQICASCVTGSLNVVGEKDMICMYCLSPIQSFKIARPIGRIHSEPPAQPVYHSISRQQENAFHDSPIPFGPLPNAPSRLGSLEASPVIPSTVYVSMVLRIDNVPWDVTPPMIEQWLGTPSLVCHVLLDRVDGRTLSHAFLETTAENARATLRTHQNKILGYGRRARAVTITLSNQEELMHALFPSWPGKFDGSRPVYETTSTDQQARPADLLTSPELGIVLHLIQSPKSHFLKVPSLAYWSLLSILVKIPVADVFAPGTVPEVLFDITTFALEKYESQVGSQDYDPVLHTKLISGAIHCKAFTERQLSLLLRFTNRPPHVTQPAFPPGLAPPIVHNRHIPPISFPPNLVPQRWHQGPMMERGPFVTVDACERVAQDFGLDSALVHALAERLVLHSSTIVPTARQY